MALAERRLHYMAKTGKSISSKFLSLPIQQFVIYQWHHKQVSVFENFELPLAYLFIGLLECQEFFLDGGLVYCKFGKIILKTPPFS